MYNVCTASKVQNTGACSSCYDVGIIRDAHWTYQIPQG